MRKGKKKKKNIKKEASSGKKASLPFTQSTKNQQAPQLPLL
jgi:hypothetical protein